MSESATSEMKTYTGGCHCGKVRYEVKAEPIHKVYACNCSICGKGGILMSFVPAAQLTVLSGEDALTDYQFNKKKIHHLFCSTCGIRSFGRGTGPGGKEMAVINVRCLDDVDVAPLEVMHVDGKSY